MDSQPTQNWPLPMQKDAVIYRETDVSVSRPADGNDFRLPYEPPAETPIEDLNAAFSSLHLSEYPSALPTTDECLAHLKLLSAFHVLKEDVGYTDGLFGLWDARCEKVDEKDREKALASLHEKRWALYVARAVDRFQDWWTKVLCSNKKRLEWKEMLTDHGAFARFTEVQSRMSWRTDTLPPLDVLMVWHTFMLNPRSYLEDCIRFGLAELWAAGMPWRAVNEAIDNTTFVYDIPEAGRAAYTTKTGHKWDNAQDLMVKTLSCPTCSRVIVVPWTTCAREEMGPDEIMKMSGTGYGDPDFSWLCHGTGNLLVLSHEVLAVDRFKRDIESLRYSDFPMGGTILTPSTGMPDGATAENWDNRFNTFPNRLVKTELLDEVFKVLRSAKPSMDQVKRAIERSIKDKDQVKKVNTKTVNGKNVTGSGVLAKQERMAVRKMMSCYWGNSSIFGIELGSAVVRQSVFVDKMCTIDWLHSPNSREIMTRLIEKYKRFMSIIAGNPNRTAVPTLDVDLAWHTHQLSPKSYYEYSVRNCRKFVNHDDKLEEDKLATGFEWTSKIYQKKFHEAYSECTCWYCETIRSSHISSTAKALHLSAQEKVLNEFHSSGRAQLCPPNNSAHISSHNAVTSTQGTSLLITLHAKRRRRKQQQLDDAYKKAVKRAEAKGRQIPPKSEYYIADTWGYPYMMYGPWQAYPCNGSLYIANPCVIPGEGLPGNCVAGACAGDVGAGACGGPGGSACGSACGGACGGGGCGGGCGGCG